LMTNAAWLAFILSLGGSVLLLLTMEAMGEAAIMAGFLLACGILFTVCAVLVIRMTGHGVWAILRIPYRLFSESRMHLLDLIFLVVVLGNGTGVLVNSYGNYILFTATACIFWVFYVLATAIWGLWVAQHLKIESPIRRCGLMVLGMAAIPGVLGVLAAMVGLACGLDMLATGYSSEALPALALSLLALFPCVFLAGLAVHFHVLASRRGTWRW
jgi:hypothetical protein